MNETQSYDFQSYIPNSLIEDDNAFKKIKAYANTNHEIAVQCCNYLHARNYNRLRFKYHKTKEETEIALKKYKEALVDIYKQDFLLYQKLEELKDTKYLEKWKKIQVENYYFLFNYSSDIKVETTKQIKTLLQRQFYFDDIKELSSKTLVAEFEHILQNRRNSFSKLFNINVEVDFDFTKASFEKIDKKHTIFFNHIKRMFLERKAFFLSILETNFIKIESFLKIIESFEKGKDGKMKSISKYTEYDFRKDLEQYVDALNNSYDFIFFNKPQEPQKKSLQNELNAQSEDEKLIDDLLETIENLNKDFKSKSEANILKKLDKIHEKVIEVKKEEAKTFYKDYFQKGKFSTLKPEEKREFVYDKVIALGNIVANDIGSGLVDVFTSKDRVKAAEKLAEKLVTDIFPVAVEALGIVFGGPLLGSFLQGLTGSILGAMFGKPPSPFDVLRDDIEHIDHHIEILQNIVVKGFTKVLEDTSLIIRKENEIEELITGLQEKIEDEFKNLQEFIIKHDEEDKVKIACTDIINSITALNNSYNKMITDEGTTQEVYVGGNEVVNNLRKMMNYFICGNSDVSTYDFTKPDYSWLESISAKSPFYRLINDSTDNFGKTTASVIKLFNVADSTLNLYAQYRKLHFANNAIIGFIKTSSPTTKEKKGYTFETVLMDLFGMQQANNDGLIVALQMHVKLLQKSVIGKNNLEIYAKYVNTSRSENLTFLDTFTLAEVEPDAKGKLKLKFQDKAKHIPAWIYFDEEERFRDNKKEELFSQYFAVNLGKDKLINYDKQSRGNVLLPVLDQVVFKLNFNDTISLIDKDGENKVARSVPYDYYYIDENSKEKNYIFKDELEFLFTDVEGFNDGKEKTYNYNNDKFKIHTEVHDNFGKYTFMLKINDTTLKFNQTIWRLHRNENDFDYKIQRREGNKFFATAYVYKWPDYIGKIDKPAYDLDNFLKINHKIKDNSFEIGDEVYSPNGEYKLHYANDDLVVENVKTKEITWRLGLFASVDKKKHKNVKARLYLEEKVLKFEYCSDTKNPEYADNFSCEFPQKRMVKLWLDDNGSIQILQKPKSKKQTTKTEGKIKYEKRRLIHRILKEGDYLSEEEYLYGYNLKVSYPRHLLLQNDGNLIINDKVPGSTGITKAWDANLKSEHDGIFKLCIQQNRLVRKNENKKDDNFVFTQRYVEDLYLDSVYNFPYINSETTKDYNRRLFLYTLHEKDVLYEGEYILSPNKEHYFKILPKGEMECKYGENDSNIWTSGGNLEEKDLEFKNYSAYYEVGTSGEYTGKTFQFYSRNYGGSIIDNNQRGFYLRHKEHNLYSSIKHARANDDIRKVFSRIEMLYMMDDGKLVGAVTKVTENKETETKYFDLGLKSSHSKHSAPEVTISEHDWLNGPKN
ncbi:hypothetical protein [uncultured Kordia sp.]|uniref:hypothetical protein n=1 Tax=uncultured Kordia sp. TaxID=507699 RepID=UPI0026348C57|nr:hypothetical protein [uncultured Kordia sp.]